MKREQTNPEQTSTLTGIGLTVVVHLVALGLVSFNGLTYIYPPPQEKSLLIEFTDERVETVVEEVYGRIAQGQEVNTEEAVNLVQRSQSPVELESENLTPATRNDGFGDVEVPAPEVPKEPELDPRAAFPGMAKKDTTLTGPHSSAEASAEFKEGQPRGNTTSGRADGKPNAHVEGRYVKGNIARPAYNVQESGVVVVNIWVDNYGNVAKAVPGGEGTTTVDKNLWNAARKAAMETHFNQNAEAPAMQEGTITYYFNLK